MTVATTIDSRALQCPIVLIAIKRELRKLSPGQALEVLGDNPSVLRDLMLFARNQSEIDLDIKQVRDVEVAGESFKVFLTKR